MEEEIRANEPIDRERDPEVIATRTRLYNQYIPPYYNMIYKLCIKYSYKPCNVQENYNEVLINFYRRIETYDTSRPLCTWIHIVTKRHVFALERQRQAENNKNEDKDIEDYGEELIYDDQAYEETEIDNYHEHYNDDILSVLDSMKPIYRNAFLLRSEGYSSKEISEMEFREGKLKSKSTSTVRCRVFLARQYLQNNLTRDGKRIISTANSEDINSDYQNID